MFIKAFKQRLIDCSKQEWHAKLLDAGKVMHYRRIMPMLQTASYVCFNFQIKFQNTLSKLRCSVYKLKVETGRHEGIAYEHRLCILCENNQVEDEFHFVMICPVYVNLRNVCLAIITNRNINRSIEKCYTYLTVTIRKC